MDASLNNDEYHCVSSGFSSSTVEMDFGLGKSNGDTSQQDKSGNMAPNNNSNSENPIVDTMTTSALLSDQYGSRLRSLKRKSCEKHPLDDILDEIFHIDSNDSAVRPTKQKPSSEDKPEDDISTNEWLYIGNYIPEPLILVYSSMDARGRVRCRREEAELPKVLRSDYSNPFSGGQSVRVRLADVQLDPKIHSFFPGAPVDLNCHSQRATAVKAFIRSKSAMGEVASFEDVGQLDINGFEKELESASNDLVFSCQQTGVQLKNITDSYLEQYKTLNTEIQSMADITTILHTKINTLEKTITEQENTITEQGNTITEREKTITEQEKIIVELETTMCQMQIQLCNDQSGPLEITQLCPDKSAFAKMSQQIPDGQVNGGMFLLKSKNRVVVEGVEYQQSSVLHQLPVTTKQAYDDLSRLRFSHDAEKQQDMLVYDLGGRDGDKHYFNLVVGGEFTGEIIKINGLMYDQYDEAGVKKFVQRLGSRSLSNCENLLFIHWRIFKKKEQIGKV